MLLCTYNGPEAFMLCTAEPCTLYAAGLPAMASLRINVTPSDLWQILSAHIR